MAKKSKTPELPKEPNFIRDVNMDAIPYVYTELLLQIVAQLKGIRAVLCEIANNSDQRKLRDPSFQDGYMRTLNASNDVALEEYTTYLLHLTKKYSK